ncbi:hypothetical protein B0T26DRAFT_711885 [Lasiosphaeria miniovina]|uniref:Uncharacterized protein n=1 Tax=Lasiosphaeria miniovina TaxID=1954250 RepID=A0AA40ALU5_9PEZI|nr:uncharacterized protein B0T26DRAFT_711885 [Lasiosphaeria miniovina]KAK0718107.1 hypothetical protein B0T26DRAFT_711885 [Lasiosphaeria miniovina]
MLGLVIMKIEQRASSFCTGNTAKSECHSKCMSAVNVYCLLEEPSKNYLRPWLRSSYISI